MIIKFWNNAKRASIISLVFLLLGLLVNPVFLVLVILVYLLGLLAGNIKSLEDSFVGKINKETLTKITLLFACTLLAFDVSGGGLGCLIFAIIPIVWVALTDKRIFKKSSQEASNKIVGEIQTKKLQKEEKEDKESQRIKQSSQVEVKEIKKNEEESEKTKISQNNPKSKEELSSHLNTIIEGEIYPKIEKSLSALIDLTINQRYFEDLKFVDDPELIFNDPTPFDFSKHESASSNSLYVWIHEYLKQNNLYKKFLTEDQLKKAEDVPLGEIYLPGKEEAYGLLYMHISNLHLHCLVVIVREGLKCGANVDESRKYLEDLGIEELLVDIKKIEEEQNPSNEYTDPFEGINNQWEQIDENDIPVGFVRSPETDILEFVPLKVDSEYLCQDNRKRKLSDLDRILFGYVQNQIEHEGLNSFPTFIENPDEGCFQNELLTWIKNDNSMKEIIFRNCSEQETEKIEGWMEQSEGGFRPTIYLSGDEEDYSFAEDAESLFNLLEGNAIIFAASEAGQKGEDLSLIYKYFEECGWDEEIQALKKFSSIYTKGIDFERERILQGLREGDFPLEEAIETNEETSDRELVLAAISHNGNALALASKELKDDNEIVMEAMNNNPNAFIYASFRLQSIDEIKEKSNKYKYPEDGVNEQLWGMNETVWDRGYYEETDNGTWYNLFVTEEIKGYYKTEREAVEALYNFHELNLSMYEEYNQINFFVPNSESTFTADEMTEILC